jgi:hypothetical protein
MRLFRIIHVVVVVQTKKKKKKQQPTNLVVDFLANCAWRLA